MELDQSLLETLSQPQRQKVTRQLRQKQVQQYLEFIQAERDKNGSFKRPRKDNKKKTKVHFRDNFLLQDAVENFDDREVSRLLRKGVSSNFSTGNNTSLLHKCASEDNAITAETLIKQGADVNALDDDWWSPLHMACSCDSVEMVQLLLSNDADVGLLDVDGFFPLDHAKDGSEVQQLVQKAMESKGINEKKKKELQLSCPRQMFVDVENSLSSGGSPNKASEQGISLLHIACANGYRKVIRLLLKHGADVNSVDDYGWTALHVAAKFNQLKTVQSLLKNGVDPLLKDINGSLPSAVTNGDDIRALLLKAERKKKRNLEWRDSELPDNLEDVDKDDIYEEIGGDDDIEESMGALIRINSKTVRSRHISISKEDELLEAKQREEITVDDNGDKILKQEDDEYEEIYMSKIWKSADVSSAHLPPVEQNDNLKDLADISEQAILNEIQSRFNKGQIYTMIGDILISVNPYKDLSLYSKALSKKYHSKGGNPLPPHIYGIAEQAYKSLLQEKLSQCCVISGESGAGKTESCKFIIQHLVSIANSEESNLNTKISQVNPVLEAFGNAKTIINSNSSRFAKFMELSFNTNGKITGARLTEYLLEKSRVVYQPDGECNFHIFYWMFSGLSLEEFNLFNLKSIHDHRYLQHRNVNFDHMICTTNKEKFWELKECLKFIGFSQNEVLNLLQLLAALLHLGDVSFGTTGENDSAVILNPEKLELASTMLDISSDEMNSALVAEYTVTRGEQIKKERTLQQANDCRDALTKAIYSRLFSWIVNGINQMTQPIDPSADNYQIGILDIFGFENFNRNSFEQMCINLANEQMQNYTNEYIFFKEQQDCLAEGVELVDLEYKNNQPIIDAFMEKNLGILAILDEESRFPKGTDFSLATKLHQGPGKKYQQIYKAPKDGGPTFTIVHYAGAVKYDVIGVLEKNRDTLPNAIMCTMKTSNSLLVKELFQARVTRTGSLAPSTRQQRSRRQPSTKSPFDFFKKLKGGKTKKKQPMTSVERKGPATMAFHFKNSLSELMAKIQSCKPHIIRCICSNTKKAAMLFTPDYVLAQLRYTGISETVKIKKLGFSMRLRFHDFLIAYKTLSVCVLPHHSMIPENQKCKQLLEYCHLHSGKGGHKVGKTKLFFHDDDILKLDEVSNNLKTKVIKAQAVARGYLARQKFKKLKATVAKERDQMIVSFSYHVSLQQDHLTSLLQKECNHDEERYQQLRKSEDVKDICKSLEELDTLLDEYVSFEKSDKKTASDTVKQENDPDSDDSNEYDDVANVVTNMNGRIQHMGLPPPPCGAYINDETELPPSPREMYSHARIYDTIPAEQDYVERRAPAPPRRSPSTRLSNASRTSTNDPSGDAVFHDEQQYQRTSQNFHMSSSPHSRSPQAQRKHASTGQSMSPSHNSAKPFSYFGNAPVSPSHQRHSSNGHTFEETTMSPNSPTYEPLMQMPPYSAVNRNETNARYSAPPQPPQSPKLQRQLSGPKPLHNPGSPVLPQRNSPINMAAQSSMVSSGHKQGHAMSSAHPPGHGPPSFPAPPPPLPVAAKFVAATIENKRSPSPPLPPPPPELQDGRNGTLSSSQRKLLQLQTEGQVKQKSKDEPPTPPPISKIPGTRLSTSSFDLGKKAIKDEISMHSPPSAQTGLAGELNKVKLKNVQSPQQSSPRPVSQGVIDDDHKKNALGIAAELGKVKLKSAQPPPQSSSKSEENQIPDPVKLKLNPVKNTAHQQSSEMDTQSTDLRIPKLKTTAGPKPWEKDSPVASKGNDPSVGLDIEEPPLPPPPPELMEDLPPPPPNPDFQPNIPKVQQDFVETRPDTKTKIVTKPRVKSAASDSSSSASSMADIDLDEIDYSQIPGYVVMTSAIPNWKRDMIEKKNKEKLDEYLSEMRKKKAEALKWKDVPEWKRKLLEEKDKLKREQEEAMTQAAKAAAKPKSKVPPVIERLMQSENAAKEQPNFVKFSSPKEPNDNTGHSHTTEPTINKDHPIPKEPQNIERNNTPIEPNVQREEEERKRQEKKKQIEEQAEMDKDMSDIPAWKREVMMRKGTAPTNWGDEREDINRDED